MKTCSLSHLADHVLLRDLKSLVARDRATTAELLAHLAEVDERRLYLPAAYSSMYLYCVQELHMSEDAAFRRIRVARAARRFPTILAALADGRLNLTSVLLVAPHLTAHTADELLAAA
ncbi:MAG: HNH endonuclease, partial [Candidatus Eisenbacteria bacterium]